MNILGIIPARGGSVGIPNKNLRQFGGKPLIVRTIDAARASNVFSRLVVSTDSEEIRRVAIDAGVDAPFIRAPELSHNGTLAVPVIQDAAHRTEKCYNETFDAICMLQPTTPLRTANDCVDVCEILRKNVSVESVISVVAVSQHPYKMVRRNEYGISTPFLDWPIENPPRQSLPQLFVYNGAFYLTRRDVLLEKGTFKGSSCYLYEMPMERSVNIDSEIDFLLAECLFNRVTEGK